MSFMKLASDDVPVLNLDPKSVTAEVDGAGFGSSETKEAPGRDFANYTGSRNPMDADVINKKK